MITPRRILFPTDHSRSAEEAFNLAAHIAARYGASLSVLCVRATPGPAFEGEKDRPWRMHRPPLVEHTEVVSSRPARAIVDHALEQDIDLIVMATHARGGLEYLFCGSVAEAVIQAAPCPVLVVRTGIAARQRIAGGPVLLPIDFAENNFVAAALAREATAVLESELQVLHVVETPAFGVGLGAEVTSLYRLAQTGRIESIMATLVSSATGPEVPVTTHVEPGIAASHINAVARRLEASLVVMPANGHTLLHRLLIGSTTLHVIREAPCPVLTFGPGAYARLSAEVTREQEYLTT
jgi:nucleotide-binding universal stress UspA family protein